MTFLNTTVLSRLSSGVRSLAVVRARRGVADQDQGRLGSEARHCEAAARKLQDGTGCRMGQAGVKVAYLQFQRCVQVVEVRRQEEFGPQESSSGSSKLPHTRNHNSKIYILVNKALYKRCS